MVGVVIMVVIMIVIMILIVIVVAAVVIPLYSSGFPLVVSFMCSRDLLLEEKKQQLQKLIQDRLPVIQYTAGSSPEKAFHGNFFLLCITNSIIWYTNNPREYLSIPYST